ncbi:uncharacterized protein [Zea mays]|uniref:Uncharacterized protein n=1 Tax=Zea mays TaxID=4577 RepID=A0A804UD84_MAIZE|nr:uncharacterized protein LOC111589729 isoform X4 [Zea mays]|eukprot:XP_023156361.1 uncharacterized protein LOC111589729 isoform X4 [Zea mays]
MSPARPPPPSARLRAFPRDGVLTSFYAGRFPSIPGCLNRRSCGRAGRVYCLFSGGDNRKKQDEARKALENALGKKAEFDKWGVEIERRQRGYPRDPAACGGGWSGGGSWFRRLTGGGFWDAAKQTVLTILGIIAAGALVERSGPKSSTLGLSNVAGVPVKEKAGMSAKERVVGKWAMD